RGGDPVIVRALLLGYGVQIEDVSATDAERAAAMWRRGSGLSLGDRLCLALAERLQMPVLTADRAWGSSKQVIQIRRHPRPAAPPLSGTRTAPGATAARGAVPPPRTLPRRGS